MYLKGKEGKDSPGDGGGIGGVVVREDRDDGVGEPERGVEEDEDQSGGVGFGWLFH